MTAFPIFYAVIENDLRRVLAYSLNNQLGFMVVGVGIGTELALNGTAAHAFTHIIYKALLFMSMGAVLYRVGTVKGSDLGGLYKSMPWTTAFCVVGAASISGLPFFSGFVSKSMILSAAGGEALLLAYLALLFATACMLLPDIKVPYLAFFARDSGVRCEEAPVNMRAAMAIAAALCLGLGVYPAPLYALLPYPVEYVPYTGSHVLTQLQLLAFAALAFALLVRAGVHPPARPFLNLDSDWIYRRLAPAAIAAIEAGGRRLLGAAGEALLAGASRARRLAERLAGPGGAFARSWSTRAMGMAVAGFLLLFLMLSYR
jgi:multicomponent Na+:H+ antiporter subunit D